MAGHATAGEAYVKYSGLYVPGNSHMARAVRWLAHSVEVGFEQVETVWIETKNSSVTATISSGYTVAQISVPKPPLGYKVLVEGWCAASWDSGSSLDAIAKIEVGSAALATMTLKDVSSAGSVCPSLGALHSPTMETSYRMTIDYTAARTTLDLKNRGIKARYVKEG